MDNKRRKRIQKLVDKLTPFETMMDDIKSELEAIIDEEQEVNTNLEEYFPNSERYGVSTTALEALNSAEENLSELSDQLSDMISNLETAME